MSRFLTGKELNEAICQIIWDANRTLMLVSPFIRLDDYFRNLLLKHDKNPDLHILIVFGKNEGRVNKSLSNDDFDFLRQFPNISVVYVSNLHAKYYGNEKKGVITSLNLHDHSFDHNIEYGVLSEVKMFAKLSTSMDMAAWHYSREVANNGIPVFINRPCYQKNFLSVLTGKNYVKSEVLLDDTRSFYSSGRTPSTSVKKLSEFPEEIDFKSVKGPMPKKEMPLREEAKAISIKTVSPEVGYCIRTGKEIPRDPCRPFSREAYYEWAEYQNCDYPEKYCHYTGQKTHGNNSFRRPILNDSFQNKERGFGFG